MINLELMTMRTFIAAFFCSALLCAGCDGVAVTQTTQPPVQDQIPDPGPAHAQDLGPDPVQDRPDMGKVQSPDLAGVETTGPSVGTVALPNQNEIHLP